MAINLAKRAEITQNKTNGISKEQFKILQDYINVIIKQLAKEILNGNIELKPYNKDGEKPCKYCQYKSICGFNTKMCGNSYNYIDKKSKEEIILKMKGENHGFIK